MAVSSQCVNRDVAILGGGLAGLSLALQCRQQLPDASVSVLEKNSHPVPEAAFKVGESTVEVAAHYFGKVLQLEPHIIENQLPKLGLRFFFGAGDNSAIERRLEMGSQRFATAPSYQLDRGRFENYLAQRCLALGVEFIDRARVKDIQLSRGRRAHEVRYERNGHHRTILSRWVVDASGRAALLKRKLGLAVASPHHANAAWFRVNGRIRIDDWSDDATWRDDYDGEAERWYSTNHLMGEGYWVWLIPLASGATSIGIVADERFHPLSSFNSLSKSLEWLGRHEPQCAEEVQGQVDTIMDFRAIKRFATQCSRVFSPSRWGISGEAGFFLDPFYSPGSDFIALANTFLTDLIRRDLSGQAFRFRALLYDRIFKKFFHGTETLYQDQYELFGNQLVMPVKILWDYIIYWTLTGFFFFHDRLCDQRMYVQHMFKLKKLSRLNHSMQAFFREWHRRSREREVCGRIDISSIPLVRDMNARLLEELNGSAFGKRFGENVAQVEALFWEIIDQSGLDIDVPLKRPRTRGPLPLATAPIFDVTGDAARAAPRVGSTQENAA